MAERTTCDVRAEILADQGVDIYGCPSLADDRPVLVYVPPDGDRTHTGWLASLFVPLGFLFVPVDYAVTSARLPPGHVEDVASRIAWVRGHIADHGGDPTRLFVMGYSAAAHIAALLATDGRYLAEHGIGLSALRGVILLDNDVYAPGGQSESSELDPWGATTGEATTNWLEISPGSHVASGNGIPPMLIVCSGILTETGKADVLGFVRLLVEANVEVRLHVAAERNHTTILAGLVEDGDATASAIAEFLAVHAR